MNEIPVLPETTVASVIAGVLPELVTIRRGIHAHPELSREETRTTALLRGRLDRPGTRVVFMSVYTEHSLADGALAIPNSVFLPKPFSLSELIASVENHLAGRPGPAVPARSVAPAR